MSLQNFIPTVWSARLMANLHKSQVYTSIVNRDYEGEISGAGDTVKINGIGPITVGTYTKNSTSITPQSLDDASVNLLIDQSKYFAFKIDDVDKAQTKPKVMDEAMREAAYALRDEADELIAGFYVSASITEASTALNSANIIEKIAMVGQRLNENNVPMDARWMVIPPWFHTKLVIAKILYATDNAETLSNGFVGRALGFNFYMSNNVADTTTTSTPVSRIMAGSRRAITFAEQIVSIEAYRPEASFADAVKGLHVYGAKVTDPKSLVALTATYAAET